MQRRDPRSFLEGVMATVPDLSTNIQKELLELVNEKSGTKRAARLAQIFASSGDDAGSPPVRVEVTGDDNDEIRVTRAPVTAPSPTAADTAPPPTVASPAPAPKKRASRSKKAAAAAPAAKNTNPFAGEISDEDAS